MQRLSAVRVILFGTGGVGSWCAEALVRSGIAHLTIVDFDDVAESNINRQLPATSLTIGQKKAEVLLTRLKEITPDADIRCLTRPFRETDSRLFCLQDYDYVLDAIDNVTDKAALILQCTTNVLIPEPVLISSMGAAGKTDSSHIHIARFDKVAGCPLARALRHRFKHSQRWPEKHFLCVWSDEQPVQGKGTVMHITAAFGLKMAEALINCEKQKDK